MGNQKQMSDKKSVTSLQHDATTLDHPSLQGVEGGGEEKSSYIALKVNEPQLR
jgi:hypothetical protein